MPYIKDKVKRHELNLMAQSIFSDDFDLASMIPDACSEFVLKRINAGELNYLIHEIIRLYHSESYHYNYATSAYVEGVIDDLRFRLRDVFPKIDDNLYYTLHGVLGDVIMEMYRRKKAPYEDKKISENGDIPLYTE